MKIYLAGPVFTTPEREFNVQLASRLRTAGHEVFVPQENPASERTGKAIFLKDLEGLDWADGVVAIELVRLAPGGCSIRSMRVGESTETLDVGSVVTAVGVACYGAGSPWPVVRAQRSMATARKPKPSARSPS